MKGCCGTNETRMKLNYSGNKPFLIKSYIEDERKNKQEARRRKTRRISTTILTKLLTKTRRTRYQSSRGIGLDLICRTNTNRQLGWKGTPWDPPDSNQDNWPKFLSSQKNIYQIKTGLNSRPTLQQPTTDRTQF